MWVGRRLPTVGPLGPLQVLNGRRASNNRETTFDGWISREAAVRAFESGGCARPTADGRAVRDPTAGIKVEQSLGAPDHGLRLGLSGRCRDPRTMAGQQQLPATEPKFSRNDTSADPRTLLRAPKSPYALMQGRRST